MNRLTLLFIGLILHLFLSSYQLFNDQIIFDFSLRNTNGRVISTKDYKNAKGFIVIFTCNHCPFAKLYTKRMNDLNTKFSKLNVPLLAINSMDSMLYEDETFEMMKVKSSKEKFNFPYLHDPTQTVGKQFDAQHTPMAYVIWKEGSKWFIQYKGAIDDNGEKPELAQAFVENAAEELLQNKRVSKPITESFGCRIFFRE